MDTSAQEPPDIPGQKKKRAPSPTAPFPAEGFARLPQVLSVFPVSPAHFWDGISEGLYPKGIVLSPKVTVWAVDDIRALIQHYKDRANWKPWTPPPKDQGTVKKS